MRLPNCTYFLIGIPFFLLYRNTFLLIVVLLAELLKKILCSITVLTVVQTKQSVIISLQQWINECMPKKQPAEFKTRQQQLKPTLWSERKEVRLPVRILDVVSKNLLNRNICNSIADTFPYNSMFAQR